MAEQLNFLYRFETPSAVYAFTDIAEGQSFEGEDYLPIQIEHTSPKFSEESEDAEIEVTLYESNPVANLFVLGPPPYPIKIHIYEFDRASETVADNYDGWVVRSSFNLNESTVSFRCKTVGLFFERESFTDSISALSRYSVFDPRSGVDLENYRVGITIESLNDERDVLIVTGITEPDDHFRGGLIVAPDLDKRTIIEHKTISGDKVLTLNAAFPRFTLAEGFTADIYPGDDLTYSTWANKFSADTNNGEAHGGWQHTPNVDPAIGGVG
jgi:hypothetical protein